MKMKRTVLRNAVGLATLLVAISFSATTGFAQVESPSRISIQGTGLFTRSLNDQIPSNEASKSGGFLVGYSYQFNKWIAAEGNYGYSRNSQNFVTLGGPSAVQTDLHEAIGSVVVYLPGGNRNIQPYALGGGGAVIFNPTDKFVVAGTDRQTRGAFVYGGGANFRISNNIAFRAEYRGLLYKVPDFGLDQLNLDKFTHLAQPSAGIVFRF
jgi:outer membrane immunogenic protein